MKNRLLTAFVFLLHAVCASEPVVASGFYLNQQPISVEQACDIMFGEGSFQELPKLSVIAPLNADDAAVLAHVGNVRLGWVIGSESKIWDQWMAVLQIPEEHTTIKQYKALYQCLQEAIRRPMCYLSNRK